MLSYGECIALDDGIVELLELIDDEDFKRNINNLIEKLQLFKKSDADETRQVNYLLNLVNDMIIENREYQKAEIQYDICQIGSIVLYVEIISELYAVDFWKIYEAVPHERIML